MPALEPLTGLHVVAESVALDAAVWTADARPVAATPRRTMPGTVESEPPPSGPRPTAPLTVIRFAPDEAFAVGARDVEIGDPDAIVVDEFGFVGAWCSLAEVGHHIDWSVPDDGPVLAQGAIAGVPAKLWIPGGGERVLLVVAAPFAHELSERLGWLR